MNQTYSILSPNMQLMMYDHHIALRSTHVAWGCPSFTQWLGVPADLWSVKQLFTTKEVMLLA